MWYNSRHLFLATAILGIKVRQYIRFNPGDRIGSMPKTTRIGRDLHPLEIAASAKLARSALES